MADTAGRRTRGFLGVVRARRRWSAVSAPAFEPVCSRLGRTDPDSRGDGRLLQQLQRA
jgi:hypothetical protein